MQKEDKTEQKTPLDMTSDEAMQFLFSDEVVTELKKVANPEPKRPEVTEKKEDDCDSLPYE